MLILLIAGAALPVLILLAHRLGTAMLLPVLCALVPFPISIVGAGETGLNISPVDCGMAILTALLFVQFLETRHLLVGPPAIPLTVFLLVATVSSILYGGGKDSYVSLARMALLTVAAMLVFASAEGGIATARRSLLGYLVGINVLSICSVALFAGGGFHASEYALGINKNGLGPIFGSGVVIAVAFLLTHNEPGRLRTWLVLSLCGAAVGLLLCLSRGGWIATAVAMLFLLFSTGRVMTFVGATILVTALVVVVWSFLPAEATDYATDVSPDTYVIRSRFDSMEVAMNEFRSSPLLGVGVGLRKRVEPHNVLVLTLGETGIAGLLTFVLAFGSAFYTLSKARHATEGDLLSQQVLLAGTAVMLVTVVHGLMDVYWRRGVGVLGWACVGMAVQILATQRAADARPAVAVAPAPVRAVRRFSTGSPP